MWLIVDHRRVSPPISRRPRMRNWPTGGLLAARVDALEVENLACGRERGELPSAGDDLRTRGCRSSGRRDGAAAGTRRPPVSSQRRRSKDRRPGGQKGRRARGLEPTDAELDEITRTAEPPTEHAAAGPTCEAADAGATWACRWDILPVAPEQGQVGTALPPVRCCRHITTAAVPDALSAPRHGELRPGRQRRRRPAGLGGQRAGRADRDADGGAAGRPGIGRVAARAHRRLAERLETAWLHHRAQGRA